MPLISHCPFKLQKSQFDENVSILQYNKVCLMWENYGIRLWKKFALKALEKQDMQAIHWRNLKYTEVH